MTIFDKTHRHCAECGAVREASLFRAYPWGRKPGESRILICPECVAHHKMLERREANANKVKNIEPPTAKAVQEK